MSTCKENVTATSWHGVQQQQQPSHKTTHAPQHSHTSLIMSGAPSTTCQRSYLTSNKTSFGPVSGTKANTPHLIKHKNPPDVYKTLLGSSVQMLFSTDHPADRSSADAGALQMLSCSSRVILPSSPQRHSSALKPPPVTPTH